MTTENGSFRNVAILCVCLSAVFAFADRNPTSENESIIVQQEVNGAVLLVDYTNARVHVLEIDIVRWSEVYLKTNVSELVVRLSSGHELHPPKDAKFAMLIDGKTTFEVGETIEFCSMQSVSEGAVLIGASSREGSSSGSLLHFLSIRECDRA